MVTKQDILLDDVIGLFCIVEDKRDKRDIVYCRWLVEFDKGLSAYQN